MLSELMIAISNSVSYQRLHTLWLEEKIGYQGSANFLLSNKHFA